MGGWLAFSVFFLPLLAQAQKKDRVPWVGKRSGV